MANAPRTRALKVYRTPIGFHDAYVAAPSQKAALKAWGASADLFARGAAEVVSDAALTAAPLAAPGVVVRLARGTADEHMAALPVDAPRAAKPERATVSTPRPSRAALDATERAIASARERQRAQDDALAEREAAVARERRDARRAHADQLAKLEHDREEAKARYDDAVTHWQG